MSRDEPAAACLRLGAGLRRLGDRVGLLVMADGSACRSLRAPGYLDPRAAAFDAVLERAVRTGDLGSLQDMDDGLARELLATARPGWQVLAGAMPAGPPPRRSSTRMTRSGSSTWSPGSRVSDSGGH